VDTDQIPATESQVGDLVQNVTEAVLVQQFTECLLRSGIHAEQIGVVTLYRQQIKLLSHLLSNQPDVEILTADRSQGRDKDCIIMSMVRSNEEGTVRFFLVFVACALTTRVKTGDLMKDWRRMNVAFTRARSKLVIFGSRSTLARTSLLESFFQLMEGEGWIVRLSRDAHEAHAGALSLPKGVSTEHKHHDRVADPKPDKEDREKDLLDRESNKRRRFNPSVGLLRGRPVLREVFNDIIDLT
jgi:DNA replication ATP-dependent helicase Dna2